MIGIRRVIAAAALALTAGAVIGAPAASARTEAAWADDHFDLCVPDTAGCYGRTYGTIAWSNRSANITGAVVNGYSSGYVTAFFEAYDGSLKIDSETRTAHSGTRGFAVGLGDPDRVGGFDRVKVTVCWNGTDGSRVCSTPQNHWRD